MTAGDFTITRRQKYERVDSDPPGMIQALARIRLLGDPPRLDVHDIDVHLAPDDGPTELDDEMEADCGAVITLPATPLAIITGRNP